MTGRMRTKTGAIEIKVAKFPLNWFCKGFPACWELVWLKVGFSCWQRLGWNLQRGTKNHNTATAMCYSLQNANQNRIKLGNNLKFIAKYAFSS